MREWAGYLLLLALPPLVLGFGDLAGKSDGIARTLGIMLFVLALVCAALSFRRRRS